MKNASFALYLLVIGLFSNSAFAQDPIYPWDVTIKAVDDSGEPVPGANARIAYENQDESYQKKGLTDTNGVFHASHVDDSTGLGIVVEKYGHYPFRLAYGLLLPDPLNNEKFVANRNLALDVSLKKVRNPIPMYAKSVNLTIPALEKPVGYDLMIGDWVAPYGKGDHADFIFTGNLQKRAANDWSWNLILRFSNPGDGIQPFTITKWEKYGKLRSPYEAPENGYESQWIKDQSQKPGQPSKYGLDKDLNFFFRVRTVLDENGKVKSALYGKIYGDFMKFRYYLNPTPKSRNVEFNPKQNLTKGLRPYELVDAP